MAKIVNTLRWREKGREEEESLKMPNTIPKMFATDACMKVPLFNVASPLRHSVAYVMTEGQFHHITPLQAWQRLLTLRVGCH